jgi:hypothetical protein
MATIKEVRIAFPDDGAPLVSVEVALPNGGAQYAQARLGGRDETVILPGESAPTSILEVVSGELNRLLAARIVAPWDEPTAQDAAPAPPREEDVWVGGAQIRRSLSLSHPDAAPLRALLEQHVRVPGVDPTGGVVFVGTTEAGALYPERTLNVYYRGDVPEATRVHFAMPEMAQRNRYYFGLKVHLNTGAVALRVLDHDVEAHLPLPVPPFVELPGLRFGIARHYGPHSAALADAYFETDRHADVATWCASIGQPAPKSGLTGSRCYGVTWDVGTGQVQKVKVYVWSEQFSSDSQPVNLTWTRQMLQNWKRSTLRLT